MVRSSDRCGPGIGIAAPATGGIQREELVSRIAAENRRATARATGTEWLSEIPLKQPAV